MTSTCLAYDGLRFAVSSPVADHVAWLEQFVAPHFTNAEPGDRPIRVSLTVDPDAAARHAGLLEGAAPRPAFMYDSRVMSLPCVEDERAVLLVHEPRYGAFYEVSADRRDVAIVIAEDSIAIRTPLNRVVREYAMNAAHAAGDFFLHASCFTVGGRTIVVTGPRAAGKTTLVVFACLHGGAAYVSNDRVRVGRHEGGYRLSGMPVIINIREGTTAYFPSIRDGILRDELHHRLLPHERPSDVTPPQQIGDDGAYELSTAQFCGLLGTRAAAGAADPVVVIPHITHRPGMFSLERLEADEAFALLQQSLFGAEYWATSTPVFNLSSEAPPDTSRVLEKCRRFAEQVPVLSCELGTELYAQPTNAAEWLSAILDAG